MLIPSLMYNMRNLYLTVISLAFLPIISLQILEGFRLIKITLNIR